MRATSVPWRQARDLAGRVDALPVVVVPLAEAGGAVLATDLRALDPLPAVDTAAMDGYAVAGAGPWRCLGVVPAGTIWAGELRAGDAVEIATGAAVPTGTSAVLRHEDADVSDDGALSGDVQLGSHVRGAGVDVIAGDLLAAAGTRLNPLLLGLAAATGFDTLTVHRRPRVAVVVTGAEIRSAGRPSGTAVRDALGPALPGLLAGLGDVVGVRHVGDDGAALAAALDTDADVHVVTGGSSLGPADRLHKALADLGCELLVDGVACRPGRPQLLARRADGRRVVGLPGNPLAAVTATLTLLAPLLSALGGERVGLAAGVQVPSPPGLPAAGDRTLLLPAVLDARGSVAVLPPTSSASLRSVAVATHLLVVEDDDGDEVLALPLRAGV